jgi:hypothetical protein
LWGGVSRSVVTQQQIDASIPVVTDVFVRWFWARDVMYGYTEHLYEYSFWILDWGFEGMSLSAELTEFGIVQGRGLLKGYIGEWV